MSILKRLFGRTDSPQVPGLDAIDFRLEPDEIEDTLVDETDQRVWLTPRGEQVSVHRFCIQPDIAAPPGDLDGIRDCYRSLLTGVGGAIVSVEESVLHGHYTLQNVFKLPMEPTGVAFISSVTLPFADCSFVLKAVCPEIGTTGVRESVLFLRLADELDFNEQGEPVGWARDPYDASLTDGFVANRADAPEHDVQFPESPAARARAWLGRFNNEVRLSPDLAVLDRFMGPTDR